MTPERWYALSPHEQLQAIAAEIKRAEIWERSDPELYTAALERAFELLGLSLEDRRWKGQYLMLLLLREELAKFYIGAKRNINALYAAI